MAANAGIDAAPRLCPICSKPEDLNYLFVDYGHPFGQCECCEEYVCDECIYYPVDGHSACLEEGQICFLDEMNACTNCVYGWTPESFEFDSLCDNCLDEVAPNLATPKPSVKRQKRE